MNILESEGIIEGMIFESLSHINKETLVVIYADTNYLMNKKLIIRRGRNKNGK